MAATDGAEPVELGEYEAKRRRRMEENRKKLLELNMFKIPRRPVTHKPKRQRPVAPTRRSTRQSSVERTRRLARQRQRLQRLEDAEPAEQAELERELHELREAQALMATEERWSSLRQRMRKEKATRGVQSESESESEVEVEAETEDEEAWEPERASDAEAEEDEAWEPASGRKKAKHTKSETPQALELSMVFLAAPSAQPSSSGSPAQQLSSSELSLDVDAFHSRWLGKQLFPVGKNAVMQAMCPPGYDAHFCNTSDVQSWKNGVTLFVDLESDSQYDNVFHEAEFLNGQRAVHFRWFGRIGWKASSPGLVRRLLATERGDARLRVDETIYDKVVPGAVNAVPLLLFLRRTQDPYIYCGRLGYLGYRASSQPMEFRWQLLDLASLNWASVRRLLKAP